jgi:hypothetical protein
LARHQCLHAGGFDVVDMHKNIGAAIIRQDEAKPAICVEELHPTSWHFLVAFHPIAAPPGHAAVPPNSVMNSRRLNSSNCIRSLPTRAIGFTKMAEEHEQIAQAIERRRQQAK